MNYNIIIPKKLLYLILLNIININIYKKILNIIFIYIYIYLLLKNKTKIPDFTSASFFIRFDCYSAKIILVSLASHCH